MASMIILLTSVAAVGVGDGHSTSDPYLNTDAGTMSPFEHGEVFVLDDGGEVDLDLGNYERFLDVKLTRDKNITTGKIYQIYSEALSLLELCRVQLKVVQLTSDMLVNDMTDALSGPFDAFVPIVPCDGVLTSRVHTGDADTGKWPQSCIILANHKLKVMIALTMPESDYKRRLGVVQV